jgi:hypothetical protein
MLPPSEGHTAWWAFKLHGGVQGEIARGLEGIAHVASAERGGATRPSAVRPHPRICRPLSCHLQPPGTPPPCPLPSTISVWWLRSTVFEKVRSSLQQFASFDRLKVTVGNVPLRSSNLKRIVFVARMGLHGPTISILQYPTSL